jgi:NAD(P)-dependent dehydrogenase (short-subunit alcohol dehydrogenase family)
MTRKAYDLAGKVAFITGGNGGVGSATARELVKRGARVVIADLDSSTPLRAFELGADKALGCVADVPDRASLDDAVTRTIDRFGRLDVVIANAGLLAKAATLRNTPIADLEATWRSTSPVSLTPWRPQWSPWLPAGARSC